MDDLIKILQFLNKVEKLKTVKRAICISDNSRKESPAEHTWRMALMALVLHKHLKLDLDILKSIEMIIIHDIVEAITDDIWILDQNDVNAKQLKKQREINAAEELFSMLPDELWDYYKQLWFEYEEWNSIETKFSKALDKLEVMIQRIDLGVWNWERTDFYEILVSRADNQIKDFPQLSEFCDLVKNEITTQFTSLQNHK